MTTEFENLLPLIPAGEEWPDIPIGEVAVTFAVFPGGETLAEAVDLATVTVGRFGLDQLDVIIEDVDNPERRWMVREGVLYDLSPLGQAYEPPEASEPPSDTPDA